MTEHHVERTLRGWAEVAACAPDFSLGGRLPEGLGCGELFIDES